MRRVSNGYCRFMQFLLHNHMDRFDPTQWACAHDMSNRPIANWLSLGDFRYCMQVFKLQDQDSGASKPRRTNNVFTFRPTMLCLPLWLLRFYLYLSQSIDQTINFFSAYSRSLLSAPQTHQSVRAKEKSTLILSDYWRTLVIVTVDCSVYTFTLYSCRVSFFP